MAFEKILLQEYRSNNMEKFLVSLLICSVRFSNLPNLTSKLPFSFPTTKTFTCIGLWFVSCKNRIPLNTFHTCGRLFHQTAIQVLATLEVNILGEFAHDLTCLSRLLEGTFLRKSLVKIEHEHVWLFSQILQEIVALIFGDQYPFKTTL